MPGATFAGGAADGAGGDAGRAGCGGGAWGVEGSGWRGPERTWPGRGAADGIGFAGGGVGLGGTAVGNVGAAAGGGGTTVGATVAATAERRMNRRAAAKQWRAQRNGAGLVGFGVFGLDGVFSRSSSSGSLNRFSGFRNGGWRRHWGRDRRGSGLMRSNGFGSPGYGRGDRVASAGGSGGATGLDRRGVIGSPR